MNFLSNRVLLVLLIAFSLYTYALMRIFFFSGNDRPDAQTPSKIISSKIYEPVVREEGLDGVGGLEELEGEREEGTVAGVQTIQASHTIPITPRKQKFNLSCEFSAAASIIYHFTNDPSFSLDNAVEAEKTLVEKVGVSSNPNLGIRMGDVLGSDLSTLYTNLNQRFGGADFYGVHAPPFLDLFPKFGLTAKPIRQDEPKIAIQEALLEGHLVMAWIKVGFGKTVDIELAYGSVPVIRGEHVVVVGGFDEAGFFVMDPGIGTTRHIKYNTFFEAAEPFSMPFLEVYPSSNSSISLEDALVLGSATGLEREKLTVVVENGSGKVGAGTEMAQILKGFGYNVVSADSARKQDYEGITIEFKPYVKDYLYLFEKDLKLADYEVTNSFFDLPDEWISDAVVIVGK